MALDTLTEPHQLTATLSCLTSVARPLLSSCEAFPDGPTHLIRLLTLVLPGIDANDFRKAMVRYKCQMLRGCCTLIKEVQRFEQRPFVREKCLTHLFYE